MALGTILSFAIPMLFSYLNSKGVFGKTEADVQGEKNDAINKAMTDYMDMMKGYMPPANQMQGLNSVVMKALLNNMSRYANWGYPQGMGMNTDFISQFLNSLSQPGGLSRLPGSSSGQLPPPQLLERRSIGRNELQRGY